MEAYYDISYISPSSQHVRRKLRCIHVQTLKHENVLTESTITS